MNELENKYLYVINNVLQGYDREVVVNHVAELEQQKAELKELLDDAMGVLMNHEQSCDEGWLSDYQNVCNKYECLIKQEERDE